MTKFIYVFISLIAISVKADLPSFEIYERNEKGKIESVKVIFPELLDSNVFESKHFRVVYSTNSFPLPTHVQTLKIKELKWDDSLKKVVENERMLEVNEDLIQRAASVLHHLEKARDYFINQLQINEINQLPEQMIVRLEMPYVYSTAKKWDLVAAPLYNNVQTIPAENGWDSEIWFRPKKVRSMTEAEIDFQRNSIASEVKTIRKTFLGLQADMGIRTVITGVFGASGSSTFLYNSLAGQVRSFLLAEVLFDGFKYFTRLFENRSYYAIPELIPEVIYHEYSHYAFQEYLVPSHSIPAPEAIANFYASQMISSPFIAAKFKKAFKGKKTSGKDIELYRLSDDSSRNARNDFSFSFLYQLQDQIGKCRAVRLMTESIRSGNLKTTEATVEDKLKNTLLTTSFKIEPSNPCPLEEGQRPESKYTIQDKLNAYFKEKGLE